MAINFTTPNTFTPNTVISSSQVNANFSTIANVWTGLEAETTTMAKLKMDADPTIALEVATKQYVDHYSTWRRPVLTYVSATTVTIETGNQGTVGSATINFPDGTQRSDSTASHLVFDITRNASFTGTVQSGLRTSLSEATNTWYAMYAVKSQLNTTDFVAVGDTVLPLAANFATLNSNFGTSSWVYLGLIRNGDNSGATGDILAFSQCGNRTSFRNTCAAVSSGIGATGTFLVNTASGSSVTYSYAAGTGTANMPQNIALGVYTGSVTLDATARHTTWSAGGIKGSITVAASSLFSLSFEGAAGINIVGSNGAGASSWDIYLSGFEDVVLGTGSNPLL